MVENPRILVVEDDSAVSQTLEYALKLQGYRVLHASDGETGLALALRERPELVILDIRLPRLDGLAVCAQLRERSFNAPILMLTGKAMVEDRVVGLNAGADDYLSKPFAAEEFLARVNALLRRDRRGADSSNVLVLGNTRIDLNSKTATRHGQPLALSKTEYALLQLLASQPGKPVSRESMLDVVWGYTRTPTTRTIDTHIWRLRKKLGDDGDAPRWIKPVHGRGYCLSLPAHPCA